jgi:hypothetical protein
LTLILQVDPTTVEFDTRNLLFDPTDELGEGFAQFVAKVIGKVIAQTDRIMKEAVYGLNKALDNPFVIDYGGRTSSRPSYSLASVLNKERTNIFWGALFSYFGVVVGNPVFIAGGVFFALLFVLRDYLV